MISTQREISQEQVALVAAFLRIGLGLVFVIGGISKLSLLLNANTHDGMVASYMGTAGYINTLFQDFLFFEGSFLTPSVFLMLLSAFELVSGIALVAGFLIRPLALIYGFLLWSFVIALPVFLVSQLGWQQQSVGTFLALWVIGYGA